MNRAILSVLLLVGSSLFAFAQTASTPKDENGSASAPQAAAPKIVRPTRVRVSQGVAQGLLVRQVKPHYPSDARDARIQGDVLLGAIIDKEGRVKDLHVISGHPMLVDAAMGAVQQWRYRPYLLAGEPVEVETQVLVRFTLSY